MRLAIRSLFALFSLASSLSPVLTYDKISSEKPTVRTLSLKRDPYKQSQYFVSMNIGTPEEEFDLVIDLNFPYLAVPEKGNRCLATKYFNPKDSATYKEVEERQVGNITGVLSKEQFSFSEDPSVSLPSQLFFLVKIDPIRKMKEKDGVLGLGLSNLADRELSFLYSLKRRGLIPRAEAVIDISKKMSLLTISLGGYDAKSYLTVPKFAYVTPSGNAWEFDISAVAYGGKGVQKETAKLTFDYSSLYHVIPKSVYTSIKSSICAVYECKEDYRKVSFSCPYDSPTPLSNLTFDLSGETITLPPLAYLSHSSQGYCEFEVRWSKESEWVLGVPFLQSSLIRLDFETGRFGFAQQSRQVLKEEDFLPPWVIWVIVGSVILVLVISGGFWALLEAEAEEEGLIAPLIESIE